MKVQFKVKLSQQVLWVSAICLLITSTVDAQQLSKDLEIFGKRLFSKLEESNDRENIIISPLSIETSIAMARMGAKNETALEIDGALALSIRDPNKLANHFHTILAKYENSDILKIANKLYIQQGYEIQEEFKELLTNKFFSLVDTVNFGNKAEASINSWVANKSNNLIKDLIAANSLDSDTRMVLVNAIHFKGQWKKQFIKFLTKEKDFYLDEINTAKVPMMSLNTIFPYGNFPALDAAVLEMPYKNSDLSMLIILPNSRTGLADLKRRLEHISLTVLTRYMYPEEIYVEIPKFKNEFKIELSGTLKKLGIRKMFSNMAEFGNIFKSNEASQVSQFVHKAVIEVNEEGAEAAAASGVGIGFRSGFGDDIPINFIADRPFIYYIKNSNNDIIFNGNVKKF